MQNNEAKIHLGVAPQTIEKYTVYSTQVAKEMAKCISKYANSDIGIGITGNLNLVCNDGASGGEIYISIYTKHTRHFTSKVINIKSNDRQKGKDAIINFIAKDLIKLLDIYE